MMLDTDEYIHLALHASRQGDTHAAMTYLKNALSGEPDNAVAHYLLAAEHAEIGLYDRAIVGMQDALRLEPRIEIARFQLGLLLLQTQQTAAALETFSALATSAQDKSLSTFAQAYEFIIRDENTEGASVLLQQGLAECNNEALRNDMQRVLESLQPHTDTSPASPAGTTNTANAFVLDVYKDPLESH